MKKCRKVLSQITIRSSFVFKENQVFIEVENNPSAVIVEKELDAIDIDGIKNLVD